MPPGNGQLARQTGSAAVLPVARSTTANSAPTILRRGSRAAILRGLLTAVPPFEASFDEQSERPGPSGRFSARSLRCPCQRPGPVRHRERSVTTHAQEDIAQDLLESRRVLELEADSESRISVFYHTAWEDASLHGSVNGGEWRDFPFQRVSAAGGNLRVAHINVSQNGRPTQGQVPLEFVVHNGRGEYDKQSDGSNYVAAKLGGFLLESGALREVRGAALMLVSDLDDTMFGDDEASKAFKDFWERDARLRGGCLVYNTGRALDKWLSLWRDKSWCLAAPDVLISSVGTKVYHAKPDNFQGWAVDSDFEAELDEGWNLEAVREAAYRALAAVGKDAMHFRPPEEQNDHKITCGVKVDVLPEVEASIRAALDEEGITAQLIVSGRGEWRFLDIVAKRAGKLSALEYIRRKMGFSTGSTVACGDSGNDRDMLAGRSRAIVVSNAEPELREWLLSEKARIAGEDRLFAASKPMALGILEGLEHFGFR